MCYTIFEQMYTAYSLCAYIQYYGYDVRLCFIKLRLLMSFT